jgi:IS5 family transposase
MFKTDVQPGDETVIERYQENRYWQHFSGEVYFQYKLTFDPRDFVNFRYRIGPEIMKKIFSRSIDLCENDLIREELKEVTVDKTVQEKNIAFFRNFNWLKIAVKLYQNQKLVC